MRRYMQVTLKTVLWCAILMAAGCAKKTKQQDPCIEQQVETSVGVTRQFKADIEGIECNMCAQDVVDLLKAIDGVQQADFIKTGTIFEDGYIRFAYDVSERNIDIRELDQKLQDEGFDLVSLDGLFYIEPFYHEGKQYVAFDDQTALPFCYGNDINAIKRMVRKHDDGLLFAQGKIKKNASDDTFFFTLLD